MDFQFAFSVAGILAIVGWLVLLASPLMPVWSDRFAGVVLPAILSFGYFALLVLFPADAGGFSTFDEVLELFTHPSSVLAGWVHFLAFDLLVGAWICRAGRRESISFWAILPCLPITFLFGPLGFLSFSGVRAVKRVTGR